MASLHTSHGGFDAAMARSARRTLPVPATPSPEVEPRRNATLMRRYDAAALMEDGRVVEVSQVAPASTLFESMASAFARGTLIRTPDGPVAVEDLFPGDMVETGRGPEAVVWIGSTPYVPNVDESQSMLTGLTRVTADAFGPAVPAVDALLGPAARIRHSRAHLADLLGHDSVLVPVDDFRDGDRLFGVQPAGAVQFYHVGLRRHGTLNVGGMELESYHPGAGIKRALGQNLWSLFLSLFPNRNGFEDFGELTLPRTTREALDGLAGR